MALEPGSQSSEWTLTKIVALFGGAVFTIGAAIAELQAEGIINPADPWTARILMVLGFLTTLLKAMGYTQGRNALKAQELAVKGAVEVAHVLPLVQ
jgi:hypothetical protein